MKAICTQLEHEIDKNKLTKFSTVFIGGGTPSCIESKDYNNLFKIISEYIDNNTEVTIEANPNSATFSWLKDMQEKGVNRISFGVQSFNAKKLNFLARNHNKIQAIDAINNAKKIGYKNINCDIIYDTVLDNKQLVNKDLEIIKALPINHISAYSLTLEEGTKFYNKSNVRIENEELANYLFDKLEEFGFDQYEISNFSKGKDGQCKHNIGYWKYENYLGIGAGAVGCANSKRLYPYKDIQVYIDNPIKYEQKEDLSNEDIILEKTLLGFRSIVGCDKNMYNDKQLKQIYILEENDKITIKDNRIFANDYMLADELSLFVLN